MKVKVQLKSWFVLLATSLTVIFFINSCGDDESISALIAYDDLSIDELFSYDYVHPSEKGQAYLANLVIEGLNTKYSAGIAKRKYKTTTPTVSTKNSVLNVTKIAVLGDSLVSGNRQISTTVKYPLTADNFAVYLAQQLGLSTGTTTASEFVYPQTSSDTLYQMVSNIDLAQSFNMIGMPGAPLAIALAGKTTLDGTYTSYMTAATQAAAAAQAATAAATTATEAGNTTEAATQTALAASYTAGQTAATEAAGGVILWQQVLRHQSATRTASVATESAVAQMASLKPDLFVLCMGNNDLLLPASRENVDLTSETDFQTYYTGILQAMKAANADVKIVLFKIADVAAAPFFLASKKYKYMKQVFDGKESAIETLLTQTLYGQTDDTFAASGTTQTTRVIDLDKDYINLSGISALAAGTGVGLSEDKPLEDKFWLSETEFKLIQDTHTAYNKIITDLAESDTYKDNTIVVDSAVGLKDVIEDNSITL